MLGVLFLGETAFLLYASIAGTHQTSILGFKRKPCTTSDAPDRHIVAGFWMAPVGFDLLCTVITIYKVRLRPAAGACQCRSVITQAATLGTHLSHIIKTFLSEGILYFIVSLLAITLFLALS